MAANPLPRPRREILRLYCQRSDGHRPHRSGGLNKTIDLGLKKLEHCQH